ncbi:MAG: hypothetical protein BWY78_00592 [Alphaproteobacteria bacterium ADurb.Bin438]|nr:MAG: hypothetical protein BWY78_00592 [Alphaproteobacteria bacterium ADurb.Bin438]
MQTKNLKKLILISIFIISGCGITKPFIDSRREAGKSYLVGESNLDTVAVCYNSITTKKEELLEIANTECMKTNRKAVFKSQKILNCSFISPTKAYFDCVEFDEDGNIIKEVKENREIKKIDLENALSTDTPLDDNDDENNFNKEDEKK